MLTNCVHRYPNGKALNTTPRPMVEIPNSSDTSTKRGTHDNLHPHTKNTIQEMSSCAERLKLHACVQYSALQCITHMPDCDTTLLCSPYGLHSGSNSKEQAAHQVPIRVANSWRHHRVSDFDIEFCFERSTLFFSYFHFD